MKAAQEAGLFELKKNAVRVNAALLAAHPDPKEIGAAIAELHMFSMLCYPEETKPRCDLSSLAFEAAKKLGFCSCMERKSRPSRFNGILLCEECEKTFQGFP